MTDKPLRARIRLDARVYQDFSFYRWPLDPADLDTLFEVYGFGTRYRLIADGFGKRGEGFRYGNGAVYVWRFDDLRR